MADATAGRAARRSPASTTAVDAAPATAAARAEGNAATGPPSTAASENPARSLVIVVPRATHTAVTGGPDRFAAAVAAAAVAAGTSAAAVTAG